MRLSRTCDAFVWFSEYSQFTEHPNSGPSDFHSSAKCGYYVAAGPDRWGLTSYTQK